MPNLSPTRCVSRSPRPSRPFLPGRAGMPAGGWALIRESSSPHLGGVRKERMGLRSSVGGSKTATPTAQIEAMSARWRSRHRWQRIALAAPNPSGCVFPSSLLGYVLISVQSAKFPVSIRREFGGNALNFLVNGRPISASVGLRCEISLYFPVKQGTRARRRVRR